MEDKQQQRIYEVQKQIRENQLTLTQYMKDLSAWEKDISEKDMLLERETKSYNSTAPKSIEVKPNNVKVSKNKQIKDNLKRDGTSLRNYYDNWNQFDVDEELDSIELKDEKNIIKPSQLYFNKKTNNDVAPNANISIVSTSNREELKNDNYNAELIKREGTAYFKIKNYNKAIELFTQGLEYTEINDDIKLAILNNRANSYLKQKLYSDSLLDLQMSFRMKNDDIKILYRLAFTYYKLCQFDYSLRIINFVYNKFCLKGNKSINEVGKLSEDEENLFKLLENDNYIQIDNFIKKSNNELKDIAYTGFNDINKNEQEEEYDGEIKTEEIDLQVIDITSNSSKLPFNNNNMAIQEKDSSRDKIGTKQEIIINDNINSTKSNSYLDNNSQQTKEIKEENPNKKSSYKRDSSQIIKNEELIKYSKELLSGKITSSSIKLAFSNLSGIEKLPMKAQLFFQIEPKNLPDIFKNDLNKEILKEILDCLNYILPEEQEKISNFLNYISKINRFFLVVKFINKKLLNEIFGKFDKSYESSIISIIDRYLK